jgi:adenylate cyclase
MSPSSERVQRRLAAILAADVAGYSRLMSADEEGTLARLKEHRTALFDPSIAGHGGRIFKTMGDGLMVEFASVVDALRCAVEVQRETAVRNAGQEGRRDIRFRIGINLGDVMIDGDDLYGEGVNVAARLEALARVGGVCLSAKVHDEIVGKVELRCEDGGEQQLKNIAQPVRVFHWHPDLESDGPSVARQEPVMQRAASVGRKPTVIVPPFEPRGDAEQTRVLAGAAAEAVVASLANLTGISVVTTDDIADYVAKGAVQTAGQRFRATVQLLDTSSHTQFWSERFDGELADVFELLDALALRISTAVRYEIYEREARKADVRPADQQSNEELTGLAGHILLGSKPAEWKRSRELIERVLQRQPDHFMALAIKAVQAFREVICGYREIAATDGEEGLRLVRRALELNDRSDFAHCVLGYIRLYYHRDIDGGQRAARRSLELNPNYILSMGLLGATMIFSGQVEAGLAECARGAQAGMRLPNYNWFMEDIALAHFVRRDYAASIAAAETADNRQSDVPRCLLILASAAWHAGKPDLARTTAARLMRVCPEFRLVELRRWPFRHPEPWDRLTLGLVEAGLAA